MFVAERNSERRFSKLEDSTKARTLEQKNRRKCVGLRLAEPVDLRLEDERGMVERLRQAHQAHRNDRIQCGGLGGIVSVGHVPADPA